MMAVARMAVVALLVALVAHGATLLSETVTEHCTPRLCAQKVLLNIQVLPEEQGSSQIFVSTEANATANTSSVAAGLRITIRSEPWYLVYPLSYVTTLYDSFWEVSIMKVNDIFGKDRCNTGSCGVATVKGKVVPGSRGFCCSCGGTFAHQPSGYTRAYADSESNYVHGLDSDKMTGKSKRLWLSKKDGVLDCALLSDSWRASAHCLRFPKLEYDVNGHPPLWTPYSTHICDVDPPTCFPGQYRTPFRPQQYYRATKYHAARAGQYTLQFKTHIDVAEWNADEGRYVDRDTITLDQDGLKTTYANISAQFMGRSGELRQFPDLSDDYLFIPIYDGPHMDVMAVPADECDVTGLSPGKVFFNYPGHTQTANCRQGAGEIMKDAQLRHKWNTDADNIIHERRLRYFISKYKMLMPSTEVVVCKDKTQTFDKRLCKDWSIKFRVNNQIIPGEILLELDNVNARWLEQIQPGSLVLKKKRNFQAGQEYGAVSFTVLNTGLAASRYFAMLHECTPGLAHVPSSFTVSAQRLQESDVYTFSVWVREFTIEDQRKCCKMTLVSSLGIQLSTIGDGEVLDTQEVCFAVAGFKEENPDDLVIVKTNDSDSDSPGFVFPDILSDMMDLIEPLGDIPDYVADVGGDMGGDIGQGLDEGLRKTTTKLTNALVATLSVVAPLGAGVLVFLCAFKQWRKERKKRARKERVRRMIREEQDMRAEAAWEAGARSRHQESLDTTSSSAGLAPPVFTAR